MSTLLPPISFVGPDSDQPAEQSGCLRMLIASTEKTGNTWLKLLLARVYQLPMPYIGEKFSQAEADALGDRWVTHQHFLAEPRLLAWAKASNTHLLTTVRHPADLLVSLYHYCYNYSEHYKNDRRISAAIAADADKRRATLDLPHHIIDGELIRTLQDRVMCDLNISISWIQSGRSIVVRYEELWMDPLSTLREVCNRILPTSIARLEQAVEACQIDVLRSTDQQGSRFFRRALVGEWRSVLPRYVLQRFGCEEPFRSQLAFLGYETDFENSEDPPCSDRGETSDLVEHHGFENGVPFAPILGQVFADVETTWQKHGRCGSATSGSFFEWLNAPADDDPFRDHGVPRITNLAGYVHGIRPDLQRVFPDMFGADRLRYGAWFLRYAAYEYQLDRAFLTPVALSWIGKLDSPVEAVAV